MAQVFKGKVKWFDFRKGYGYVTDENGTDFFIHHSGITEGRHFTGFKEGDEIEFEVVQGQKGPQASNAKIAWANKKSGNTIPTEDVEETQE